VPHPSFHGACRSSCRWIQGLSAKSKVTCPRPAAPIASMTWRIRVTSPITMVMCEPCGPLPEPESLEVSREHRASNGTGRLCGDRSSLPKVRDCYDRANLCIDMWTALTITPPGRGCCERRMRGCGWRSNCTSSAQRSWRRNSQPTTAWASGVGISLLIEPPAHGSGAWEWTPMLPGLGRPPDRNIKLP
jgi:hypothetical protein